MQTNSLIKTALTYDDVNIIPQYSEIRHRQDIDTSVKLSNTLTLTAPVISSPMDSITEFEMAFAMAKCGGIGVLHKFLPIEEQRFQVKQLKLRSRLPENRRYPVGAAIGATADYLERAEELINANVDLLILDVAHGHHKLIKDALTSLKNKFDHQVHIMAGSIATKEAAKDLINWGADSLRVGIGSGSLCSTRIQTGVGIPMISCLQEINEVASKHNIPVIADGGLRTPGDIAKAIAAGANAVILGSLLSGTKETPGILEKTGTWPNEKLQKKYRGSASLESKIDRGETKNVEGYSTIVPYKGKVKRIIDDVLHGLRSACSYVGATTLKEFQERATFIQVTNAGITEAQPHLL